MSNRGGGQKTHTLSISVSPNSNVHLPGGFRRPTVGEFVFLVHEVGWESIQRVYDMFSDRMSASRGMTRQ